MYLIFIFKKYVIVFSLLLSIASYAQISQQNSVFDCSEKDFKIKEVSVFQSISAYYFNSVP